jgi:hypothetical protein
MFVAFTPLTTGCTGVNTSYGVSPATFLMPGLMRTEPNQTPDADAPLSLEAGVLLAKSR